MPVLAIKERLLSKSTSTDGSNSRPWFLTRHWITSFLLLKTKHRPQKSSGTDN